MTRTLAGIGYLLILALAVPTVQACMAPMEQAAPAAPPATLAPDGSAALSTAPTAAIVESAPPAELPVPAVVGWWSPDGVERPFAEPPVIVALIGRCGARVDLVLAELADGTRVWLAPADAAATPELVGGMPVDVCEVP